MKRIDCRVLSTKFLYPLWVVITLLLSCSVSIAAGDNSDDTTVTEQQVKQWMEADPVQFLENKGQMADMNGNQVPFVLFKAEAPGVDMYITEKGITYVFLKFEEEHEGDDPDSLMAPFTRDENKEVEWSRIDMMLLGATIRKENIITEGKSSDYSQYFLAHCPDGITDVHTYTRITIKDVYPGIDWVLYNSSKIGMKYDFIVHPRADASQIKMQYSSVEPLRIDDTGNIIVPAKFCNLTENAPLAYQSGEIQVNASFLLLQSPVFDSLTQSYQTITGFKLGDFDSTKILIIDPLLNWGTFYGRYSDDGSMSISIDNNGNVFIIGYTSSSSFPIQNLVGAFNQSNKVWGHDVFIIKFNSAGVRLWSTYYGGNDYDNGVGLTIDNSGFFYVTGYTKSSDFPVQSMAGAYNQINNGGNADAFLLKFSNVGVRLWATYLGGGLDECGNNITADSIGNIYITGLTKSGNFPIQIQASAYNQATFGGQSDIFIVKFDNFGACLWSTYYGGSLNDLAYSIVSDNSSNIYVTGYTESVNFPIQNMIGAYNQAANGGAKDVFILKFDSAGACMWATYYGGYENDLGCCLTTDHENSVFVTGETNSADFPLQTLPGAYNQYVYGGSYDAFVLKFDSLGDCLWSTYYGGSALEYLNTFSNATIDSCGNLYFAFETASTDISTQNSCDSGFFDDSESGICDVFLTVFSNNGILRWATFIGGDGKDFRSAISLNQNNDIYITGEWTGLNNNFTYPLANPNIGAYYDGTYNNYFDDIYIVKFRQQPLFVNVDTSILGCSNQATATPIGSCSVCNYLWSDGQTTQTATNLSIGSYTVTVSDDYCNIAIDTVVFSFVNPSLILSAPNQTICEGDSIVLTVAGANNYIWSDGLGNDSAVVVAPSSTTSYTITGTSPPYCSGTATVVVTVNPYPVVAANNQLVCEGVTASIIASGADNYFWSDGLGSDSVALVAPVLTTTYTVTGTTLGCAATAEATVTVNPNPVVSAIGSTICLGDIATLTASGANSYSWSDGLGNDSIVIATQLTTTTYSVTGTSLLGCTGSASATVVVNPNPVVSATGSTVCEGFPTTLTASGANNYSWSNGLGNDSVAVASPGATTTYTVTGTTFQGCAGTATATVFVNPNPTPVLSGTDEHCGQSNGTATVSEAYVQYDWTPTGNAQSLTGLSAGTYSVIVTDSNGCSGNASITVGFIDGPDAAWGSIIQETCSDNNGLLTVIPVGGTPPYTYTWSDIGSTSDADSALSAGNYSVTITDFWGCHVSLDTTISDFPSPEISIDSLIFSECGLPLGSAQVVINFGLQPFIYQWSNGQTTQNLLSVTDGYYSLTVTDSNGCTDSISVLINDVDYILTAVIQGETALCSLPNGSAYVSVSGAAGPFNYQWSNGMSGQSVNGLLEGYYSVTVSYGNCITSADVSVGNIEGPDANFSVNPEIASLDEATFTFSDLSSNVQSWIWDFDDGTSEIIQNPIHTYYETGSYRIFLTVADQNGCTDSVSHSVQVTDACTFWVPNSFSPNGDGINDFFGPKGICIDTDEYKLSVFNRWGENVFSTTDINKQWDGNFSDEPAMQGVYSWVIFYQFPNNVIKHISGQVTLIR